MFNLYDINKQIMNCIDEETGEIIDITKFEAIKDKETKIEGLIYAIKNQDAEAQAIKAEEEKLRERRKKIEDSIARNVSRLDEELEGKNFKNANSQVTHRKSEYVVIDEEFIDEIPEKYLKPAKPVPDKTKIKAALKTGEIVFGCEIQTRVNITVK